MIKIEKIYPDVKLDTKVTPSSKTCNHCGYVHETLPLNAREWDCLGCGEKLDRDLNASLNILAEVTSARISPITSMEAA